MTEQPSTKPILPSKVYDVLKPTVQIVLPGLSALYFTLAQIWGLPEAEKVVGTTAAVTVFLGLLLGLSSHQYNNSDVKFDGTINISEAITGPKVYQIELNHGDPERLDEKKQAIFRINPIE